MFLGEVGINKFENSNLEISRSYQSVTEIPFYPIPEIAYNNSTTCHILSYCINIYFFATSFCKHSTDRAKVNNYSIFPTILSSCFTQFNVLKCVLWLLKKKKNTLSHNCFLLYEKIVERFSFNIFIMLIRSFKFRKCFDLIVSAKEFLRNLIWCTIIHYLKP